MALQHSPSIVTSGLVLCLDAANPRSYSGSGTSWNNLGSSVISTTLYNSPTYTSGISGYFKFDGIDDYAVASSSSAYAFGGNGTIEQWVYVLGNDGVNNRFWCNNNNISSLDAYLNGASYNVYFHGGAVGTTTTISQNAWVQLIVTYTSGTIKVYFNTVEQTLTGTTTGYNITNTGDLHIAQYPFGIGYYLDGRIASMKIYNTGLTTAQITQNFEALRGRYGI